MKIRVKKKSPSDYCIEVYSETIVLFAGLLNYDPVPIISICDCLLISNE